MCVVKLIAENGSETDAKKKACWNQQWLLWTEIIRSWAVIRREYIGRLFSVINFRYAQWNHNLWGVSCCRRACRRDVGCALWLIEEFSLKNSLHGGPCGFHHRGGGFGKFWPLLHVFAGLQAGNGSKRISVAIMIHTWPCHRLALSCNSCDSMAQAYASPRDSYCSNFFLSVGL